MATIRYHYGTNGNDVVVGQINDFNIFGSFGIGFDTLAGGNLSDFFNMSVDRFADAINGGGGTDTVSYAASGQGVNINLSLGITTATFGTTVTTVTTMTSIENAVGTRYDDTISGTSGDNVLDGGAGNDRIRAGDGNDTLIGGLGINTLNGGDGNDTADYAAAGVRLYVNLGFGTAFGFNAAGTPVIQDTLSLVENVTGSALGDHLIGSNGRNLIDGGAGDDIIEGAYGGDVLHGGAGNDVITAAAPSSVLLSPTASATEYLYGDDGDDRLVGSSDRDVMDGGTGRDWVDYGTPNDQLIIGTSPATVPGVTVDLTTGTGHGGLAEGDSYVRIENVRGTGGDDVITGNADDNVLDGLFGQDTIHGMDGRDTLTGNGLLFGDGGDDTFIARANDGSTFFDGGDGIDTVDFSQAGFDVTNVYLDNALFAGTANAGSNLAGIYQFANVENVLGSNGRDFVVGSAADNQLTGNGGNDHLFGEAGKDTLLGGEGNDLLDGGAGADIVDGGTGTNTLSYANSDAGVYVNLATGTALGGDATGDQFKNVQNLIGSAGDDRLFGDDQANVISAGTGNNKLAGGGAADTFVFSTAALDGENIIADFHVGEDHLAFTWRSYRGTPIDMSDLSLTQTSEGTVIHVPGADGEILLRGVDAADLAAHAATDILFNPTDPFGLG